MITIMTLWLAIIVSALFVWIASALLWTVLPNHKKDYKGLPDEEAARNALKPQDLKPGQYVVPFVTEMKQMKDKDVVKKFEEGPVAYMTVVPKGIPSMGKNMVFSLIYYIIVGIFVAYLASRFLSADTEYLTVFRLTGTVAFVAYGMGIIPDAIWFGRPWSAVFKNLFDSLIYSLLTAGTFGWLWPN
jgi:ABC-type antimicrobial peptide transport system permease subunit